MLTRRNFLLAAGALPLIPISAQALTEGQEYRLIQPPLKTLDPKRVEVLEFFWYGCPHCFALEPDLNAWIKTLPKDVYIRRIPAVFLQKPHWIPLARAYYAVEMLGLTEKLHDDIFNDIHLSGQNLNDTGTLLNFVQKFGVNRQKFQQALNSPEIQKRLAESEKLSLAAGIHGVPSFVINGKYETSVTKTGSPEKLFATMNELIVRARHEKKR